MNIKKYLLLIIIIFYWNCGKATKSSSSIINLNIEQPSTFVATDSDYKTDLLNPNSIILGYLIDGFKPSSDQFRNMTHVAISFLRPSNFKGEITMTPGWENIHEIIDAAHANNIKVIISFGGGGYKISSKLIGVKVHRQNLIRNILNFMEKYNLDGFDSDWEPSWVDDKREMEAINNAITHHYISFIKELRGAMDDKFGKGNKSFSAAVMNANSIYYSDEKQVSHFPQNGWWNYLDWVSLMNYDNDLGSKHSTFNSVFGKNGSVAYWIDFGIPKSKIVTGVPFYARAGWGAEWMLYKDIISMYPLIADTVDFIIYSKDYSPKKEYGFNGTATVKRKVREGKNLNLPGIMFWQLAGDLPFDNQKSLLRSISTEFKR